MTVFTVGKARIARIEETYGPTYRAGDIFPEFDDHILARHAAWLARGLPPRKIEAPAITHTTPLGTGPDDSTTLA
jgi:hypothetical protein